MKIHTLAFLAGMLFGTECGTEIDGVLLPGSFEISFTVMTEEVSGNVHKGNYGQENAKSH
jgi:hypothetical protein